jgi:MoaA/NifB/PqqE/SkfB family radical SAM enzyme
MKVYIVTDGTYSDYTIERVFSNRAAAEEFKKWRNIRNEIEEWTVYDEPFEKTDGEQAMFIRVQGTVYPEAVVDIRFDIRRELIHDWTFSRCAGICSYNKTTYTIFKYIQVPADKWDEEKYKAKMTRALYDLAGIAKSLFAEGASVRDVEQALREVEEEE